MTGRLFAIAGSLPDRDMKDMAVIVNGHGNMTVDNMLGVPLCKMPGQRWIDNYGSLLCTGCRFGAEGGGFTPVYNFSKYRKNVNGNFCNDPRQPHLLPRATIAGRCAVLCVEIPNSIIISNCSTNVPPVIIDKKNKSERLF